MASEFGQLLPIIILLGLGLVISVLFVMGSILYLAPNWWWRGAFAVGIPAAVGYLFVTQLPDWALSMVQSLLWAPTAPQLRLFGLLGMGLGAVFAAVGTVHWLWPEVGGTHETTDETATADGGATDEPVEESTPDEGTDDGPTDAADDSPTDATDDGAGDDEQTGGDPGAAATRTVGDPPDDDHDHEDDADGFVFGG